MLPEPRIKNLKCDDQLAGLITNVNTNNYNLNINYRKTILVPELVIMDLKIKERLKNVYNKMKF